MNRLALLLVLLALSCSHGGGGGDDAPLPISGRYAVLMSVADDTCYATACKGQGWNMTIEIEERDGILSIRACGGVIHSPAGSIMSGSGVVGPLLMGEESRTVDGVLALGPYLDFEFHGAFHTADGVLGLGGTIQFHEPPVEKVACFDSGCVIASVEVGYACTDTTCGGPCSWTVGMNGRLNDSATPCP